MTAPLLTSRARLTMLVSCLSLACGKQMVKPPPESTLTLGGMTSAWRDYSRVRDLCTIDPAVLDGDLKSMTALLKDFLTRTEGNPASFRPEQVTYAEEARKVVPAVADSHQAIVFGARRAARECKVPPTDEALQVNEDAQKRLKALADAAAAQAQTKVEAQKWKEGQSDRQMTAREKCPVKPRPTDRPMVYYASAEANREEWLFCDNAKVVTENGGPMLFEPPAPLDKKAKKPVAKDYLDAARAYAADAMDRSPAAPR